MDINFPSGKPATFDIKDRWQEFKSLPMQDRLALYGIKFTQHQYFGSLTLSEVEEFMTEPGHELCYFRFLELEDGYDSTYDEENGDGFIEVTKAGRIFETVARFVKPRGHQSRGHPTIKFLCTHRQIKKPWSTASSANWVMRVGDDESPLELLNIVVLEVTDDCSNPELLEKYKQLLADTDRSNLLGMNGRLMPTLI